MNKSKNNNTFRFVALIIALVALILVLGTVWMGRSASEGTEEAVRSVSLLYMDELAGRREQVVEDTLEDNVSTIRTAVALLTEEDLQDANHLQAYQTRMKELFGLERFAFVDEDGLLYTSSGPRPDITDYQFDYRTMGNPEISVRDADDGDRRVIIAIPIDPIPFEGDILRVCFMELRMSRLLADASITSGENGVTFCNLYTNSGTALTDLILGGQAAETNLLDAMGAAEFETGYSYEQLEADFREQKRGVVSFSYGGIRETMSYTPIEGTDWMLTYLIRESVIDEEISVVSDGIIRRSLLQSVMTALILSLVYLYIIRQNREHARMLLEKETSEAEMRGKQEELQERLRLQEQLLEQKEQQEQQREMITALASDYFSVYYLELDKDEGICYQAHSDIDDGFRVGDRFRYLESVTSYANRYITDGYREEFLKFIRPENILARLQEEPVISYRYMVHRHGKDSYEMVRFAVVHQPGEKQGEAIYNVGACFSDIDAETRKALEQSQNLSDALAAAEEANRAKTAFLSNMSHEIRTPMNAIIGLDNIALNDPEATDRIRGYLEKIGDSANHLLGLINDILDMSRIESGRMTLRNEEFSFSKLLEHINTMFSSQCEEKGLEYNCRINGHLDDHYIGDAMKLRQVLINILGNAVKFTPAGGSVELTAEKVAGFDGKSTLRFTIADTGIGMSAEFLPHIFDVFTQEDSSATNKYGSSGLGLSITKIIVEMMNGNIEVESEKGKGSTFTVTVTLADVEKPTEDDEIRIKPHEMTVLIVDDDPIACEHGKLVLEKAGIASEIAESGAEALEMVQLRQARRAPYNLILLDWQMPEMDGVEAARRIREIAGDSSAIIILTAYRWDDVLEEALEAGVDSFLTKPLFASAVLEEFRSALERKKTASEERGKAADLKGRKVLLAEDVQINAEIMQMVLSAREIEVDLAENGRIAVEKFTASEPGHYDAVLMDMRMPEMDGLEATRCIRAMDRPDAVRIPIIALTANAFDEDVQRSLQAGLNAHLSKPVEPELLYETLESLIEA
ncbi:MAG: response regulator [Mogibacterium sp.]|nr:response regulator [Mogibacterium sp.]